MNSAPPAGSGSDSGPAPNRRQLRRAFLAAHRWGDAELLPLRPDASFRRYLRARQNRGTAMLMDAPPALENTAAFVAVTRHLEKIGVRVPAILASDIANGFLLLEDLGDQTFARLLARDPGAETATAAETGTGTETETALYRQAIGVLGRINRRFDADADANTAAADLPRYDVARALAEANLLLDWYLPARLERPVSAGARAGFRRIWDEMLGALPPLTPTLTLRDFHIDNLMLCGGECAVLDYQDALIGSPAYDLASLLEDARRDIAPALTQAMLRLYHAQNPGIDPRRLHRHYLVWGAQRHCKVAGIFVRLWLRDGKDAYLRHLPRVLELLQRHLHEPALAPLRRWLDEHLGEQLGAPGAIRHDGFPAPAEHLRRHCTAK